MKKRRSANARARTGPGDDDDESPRVTLDLLEGIRHPPGWEVRFIEISDTESLSVRMPQVHNGLRAFLSKRRLWNAVLDMPAPEYWAISDAMSAARVGALPDEIESAKAVLWAIAGKAMTALDPAPLKRLIAAIAAVTEWERLKLSPRLGGDRQSETVYLYRTAFMACCMILRRLPTKGELTREAEEWKLRLSVASARRAPIPPHVIKRVPAKDDAMRSRDRKASGLDWLPDDDKAKGRRRKG